MVTNREVLLREGLSMLPTPPVTPGPVEKWSSDFAIWKKRGIYYLLPIDETAVVHPQTLVNPSSAYLLRHPFDGKWTLKRSF